MALSRDFLGNLAALGPANNVQFNRKQQTLGTGFHAPPLAQQGKPPTAATERLEKGPHRPLLTEFCLWQKPTRCGHTDGLVSHLSKLVEPRFVCNATSLLLARSWPASENRQLSGESTLEGGACFTAGDIGGEVRKFVQYPRSLRPKQHRHHLKVARVLELWDRYGSCQLLDDLSGGPLALRLNLAMKYGSQVLPPSLDEDSSKSDEVAVMRDHTARSSATRP